MKLKFDAKCRVCGHDCKDKDDLAIHLNTIHGMNAHVYYDQYVADANTGKCANCGKPTNWRNLLYGYDRFCSAQCSRQFMEKNGTTTNIPCPICGAMVSGDNANRASIAFNRHLKDIHDLTPKEYYDQYLKTPEEGTCPECGKPTEFKKISVGYQKFCCNACSIKYSHRKRREQLDAIQDFKDEQQLKAEKEQAVQEAWQEEMKERLAEFDYEGERNSLTYTDWAFERTFPSEITFF